VVIVADPRLTHTAWLADIFLQIKPGTDVALLNGMANVIVNEGLTDGEFVSKRTRGYSAFAESLRDYTPQRVSEIAGVPAGDIVRAARAYAISPASSIVYSMGITQHSSGTSNVVAISNLALSTGHIGRPGAGIFPLRGQNNVQGACDMGALAEYYPGYRRAEDPEAQELFSLAWGRDLPAGPGLTSTEMIDAILEGKIRALYIVGEDPANSDSHSSRVRAALESLDFLVVQDIFPTATAQLADVVLPAAAWAEKEGTFTSTERRVQWSQRAISPPGEARADLEIICGLAGSMGLAPQFSYPDAASVLSEISRLVPAYAGITYERLGSCGLVWPCPDAEHPGTPILHSQGFKFEEGRALLLPVKYQPASEDVSPEYPLLLTTGRVAVHHNAGSMTRRSPSLLEREPELFIEINPSDAVELKVEEGDEVTVESARGRTPARARLTERVKRGVVFMPFHFPGTNLLTTDARDPHAKIPQFNVAACRISRRD
jgi:formate dehydrogenase major subunit